MRFRDWFLIAAVCTGLFAYQHPNSVTSLVNKIQNALPAQSGTAPSSVPPAEPSPQPAASGGATSTRTVIRPALLMQSVSIQNSPGVADVGGHSILGGLLTGNLHAVEPNLVVCVTPTGTTGARRSCTGICPPGHDCKKRLLSTVRLDAANPSVHVEVLDNDKEGRVQKLAAFDEKDATQCTATQPCKVDDSADQGSGMLVSFVFGKAEGCDTTVSLYEEDPVLLASTTFLPGLLSAQTSTSGSPHDCAAIISGVGTPFVGADFVTTTWAQATADSGCPDRTTGAPLPPTRGISIEAPVPRYAVQFVQFVKHVSDVPNLTNPNADWDRTGANRCYPKMIIDGKDVDPPSSPPYDQKDPCGRPYFLPRDAGKWYVDARGIGEPGQQDPNYIAGQGAAWCASQNSTKMFDAPSTPAEFKTIVLNNRKIVGIVHWFSTGSGWYAVPTSQILSASEKLELCGAANIQDYKAGLLAAVCN